MARKKNRSRLEGELQQHEKEGEQTNAEEINASTLTESPSFGDTGVDGQGKKEAGGFGVDGGGEGTEERQFGEETGGSGLGEGHEEKQGEPPSAEEAGIPRSPYPSTPSEENREGSEQPREGDQALPFGSGAKGVMGDHIQASPAPEDSGTSRPGSPNVVGAPIGENEESRHTEEQRGATPQPRPVEQSSSPSPPTSPPPSEHVQEGPEQPQQDSKAKPESRPEEPRPVASLPLSSAPQHPSPQEAPNTPPTQAQRRDRRQAQQDQRKQQQLQQEKEQAEKARQQKQQRQPPPQRQTRAPRQRPRSQDGAPDRQPQQSMAAYPQRQQPRPQPQPQQGPGGQPQPLGNPLGQAGALLGNTLGQAMGGGGGGKETALQLRLDLNLDVDVQIKATIHGDVTLSLL